MADVDVQRQKEKAADKNDRVARVKKEMNATNEELLKINAAKRQAAEVTKQANLAFNNVKVSFGNTNMGITGSTFVATQASSNSPWAKDMKEATGLRTIKPGRLTT